MNERTAAVVGALIVSMFIGCSYERNIGKVAQAPMPQQSHGGVIITYQIELISPSTA